MRRGRRAAGRVPLVHLVKANQQVIEAIATHAHLRPLIKVDALTGLMNFSSRDLSDMRDAGQLGVVFNVASDGARRGEWRVWSGDLVALLTGAKPSDNPEPVVANIIPHRNLTTRDLRNILDISHLHAQRLALELGPIRPATRGVNGAAVVDCEIFREWLQRRAS